MSRSAYRLAPRRAAADLDCDPDRGLDPNRVVREAVGWAVDAGVLPRETPTWLRDRSSDDPELRYAALDALGRTYALFGAYSEQISIDREASELKPRELAPRRIWNGLAGGEPASHG